jgi:alpha-L-fucosidase
LTEVKEWNRLEHPVMMPGDADARWYDNQTIYKSTVIRDRKKTLGHPFVMYYNAKNNETAEHPSAERIAVAVSDDMTHWQRYGDQPVIDHHSGISGDAFITKMNDLWVMFYFGAFWKPGAFERFACSYDLVNWTKWEGEDLIAPSEPFDDQYAHKPYVLKYNGVVYHFYNAVNKAGDRGIAVATSKDLRKKEETMDEKVKKDRARGILLPKTDGHYKPVQYYVEENLDTDYLHAPEVSYEAFRDMKFSVRIHWGIYSIYGARWGKLTEEYNQVYKTFNPTDFNAQEWMDIFKRSGIEAFAFTTKHHEGFSLFHTKTRVKQRVNYLDDEHPIEPCDLSYSIEETPFKRDVVKELCDAARKNNIKIDLYFSHNDWYDADFRPYVDHPLTVPALNPNTQKYYGSNFRTDRITTSDRTQEETDRMIARHREQLHELLSNYGKIDMLCLDMWLGQDVWPQLKETVKLIRKWQPDIMIRSRGKGGSFMVGIGPDGMGNFDSKAVEQLEETGRWLKVNGKGIYATRECEVWKENDIYFTRTKDHKSVFAFVEKWPGNELVIPAVTPKKGSKIYLLGHKKPLKWILTETGIKVIMPEILQTPQNRPCEHAWGFEITIYNNQ